MSVIDSVCVCVRVFASTFTYANAVMTGWLHYGLSTKPWPRSAEAAEMIGGQNYEHKLICCLI